MNAGDILNSAAETFRERNVMYRENWKDVGATLAALFPAGISLKTPQDHTRFHFLVLMIVKISRYANMWDNPHADSMRDLAVYAAMLESYDAKEK